MSKELEMPDDVKPASPLPWTYCGCKYHQHLGAWNSDSKRASGYTRAIQARVEAVVAARNPKEPR